jgi:hypothetical protein
MPRKFALLVFLFTAPYLFSYPDFLRQGVDATDEEIAAAVEMYNQGWRYIMPTSKSPQARWGNADGRTTWNNGWWRNEKTGAYSSARPRKNGAGQYAGNGENELGTWRPGDRISAQGIEV